MANVVGKRAIHRSYFSGMNSYDEPINLDETQMVLIENAVINRAGQIVHRKGLTKIGSGISAGLHQGLGILETSATKNLYVLTGTDLYKLVASTWTSIDSGFTNNTTTFMIQANDKMYVSNGTDNVHSVDAADTVTDLGDTNTDPPKSTIMEYHDNRLFVGLSDLVYFSDVADPETFDRAVNNFRASKGAKGVLTALKSFKEKDLVIYKENSILALNTAGANPLTEWQINILNSDIGCPAGRTVVSTGDDHIFLAYDGVRLLSRTQFDKTASGGIVSEEIQDFIEDINWDAIDTARAVLFDNKYILSVPLGVSTVADTVLIYDLLATSEIRKRGKAINSWVVIPSGTWEHAEYIVSRFEVEPKLITCSSVSDQLEDNASQTYNQAFTSSTGFTFDSNDTEFSGGQVQQLDQAPADATFYANYTSDINGTWGDGTLTGTGTGSPAVSGGKLDLKNGSKYVDYPGTDNASTATQTGAIRFTFTPDYTGSPASNLTLISVGNTTNSNSLIRIRQQSSGLLNVVILDNAAATIVNAGFGTWSPTSGTDYEFELNYDVTAGATRLFIAGTQVSTTKAGTGTRTAGDIDTIRVGGQLPTATETTDGDYDDLILFDTVQHTANYTPGASIPQNKYVTDVITLPTFTYSGDGTTQSFDAFATTEANSPRYVLNGEYWNGSAWVTSSDTYATASSKADVNANISTLTVSDTLIVKVITDNGASQMSVDDLTVTYTGQANTTQVYKGLEGGSDNGANISFNFEGRDEFYGDPSIDSTFSHFSVSMRGSEETTASFFAVVDQGESVQTEPGSVSLLGGLIQLPVDLPFSLGGKPLVSKELHINRRGRTCRLKSQHSSTNGGNHVFLGYTLWGRQIGQTETS